MFVAVILILTARVHHYPMFLIGLSIQVSFNFFMHSKPKVHIDHFNSTAFLKKKKKKKKNFERLSVSSVKR